MRILCHTVLVSYFAYVLITQNVFGQNNASEIDDNIGSYDENLPYCFRFTWVGPEFDNSSNVNTTCADYLENTRASGVPCRQPLVVTYDGTPPDINYMWENYKSKILCRQARGQVCAKYSYTFNNELQNVTYMCTKAFAKGEGAVTNGCFKQMVNEYEVELCVCESSTGPYKPCNGAPIKSLSATLLILSLLAMSNRYLQSFIT